MLVPLFQRKEGKNPLVRDAAVLVKGSASKGTDDELNEEIGGKPGNSSTKGRGMIDKKKMIDTCDFIDVTGVGETKIIYRVTRNKERGKKFP